MVSMFSMSPDLTLSIPEEVFAALLNPALEPPSAPECVGAGPTANLRAAMARFSPTDLHASRRHDVVELINSIDPLLVHARAAELVQQLVAGRTSIDLVAELAYELPASVLIEVLGLHGERRSIVSDTFAIVEVIGRGCIVSPQTDQAVGRLLAAGEVDAFDPIAVVSVLYQTFDAVAALVIETFLSRHHQVQRAAAVKRTVRVAASETTVLQRSVAEGQTVVLDLDSSGLEFGAGPHRCPGGHLAEAIVGGLLTAIDSLGFEVVEVGSEVDHNGRPASINISQRS
jgi:hypothetical protein